MGSVDTLYTCEGFFTDSGGGASAFSANENSTITICSDTTSNSGSHIKLLFREVSLLRQHQLCFFDGSDISAPLLACAEDFSDDLLSADISVFSSFPVAVQASAENTTGCITVTFNSDDNVRSGWYAEISCIPACQKIEATLASSAPIVTPIDTGWIDACPDQEIVLTGQGIFPQEGLFYNHRDSSEYIWDMGDGNIQFGPTISHAYTESGGYTIQLTIKDQLGCTNSTFINQRVRIATKPSFSSTGAISSGCSGDTITLNAAVNANDPNSVISVTPTQGTFLAKRILADSLSLPDGTGEAYTSGINFSNFSPGQTLQNIEDLIGVCVNIEHSYLRDLEITLTCPSGQSIIMHEYPGRFNSSTVHLGEPINEGSGNEGTVIPGNGYEYCWTPNAPNGTWVQSIRDPDDLITVGGEATLPEGDYSTFDPMTDLEGCPLNGEWMISVEDLWASDNGFIFSWGIEFNPNLYPEVETFTPSITSFEWKDHPTIIDKSPNAITAVTNNSGEASYLFSITDDFGCVWDTAVSVTVLPPTSLDCYECEDFSIAMRDTTLCSGANVQLQAGPAFTETVVGFETTPFYDQLGFPNHRPLQEYQSTIEVTDVYPGTIDDPFSDIISICVDIETAPTDWVSDLELSVLAPDGTLLILSTNNGGAGSNYTNTCFTPRAVTPIESGAAPFTGDFLPEDDWGILQGVPSVGTWTMQVADGNGPQLGVFNSWSITFNSRNGIDYTWTPADDLSCDDCPNPTAQPDGVQNYQVNMTDVFGCSYDQEVNVGSVQDFIAPTVSCSENIAGQRQVTFNWTDENNGTINYEIRIDSGMWVLPNNGDLSHIVDGLSVNQEVTIEVRPFISGIPENCDIPIAKSTCTYDLCDLAVDITPTAVSCSGLDDGSLTYELTDGTAPFDLIVDGITVASSEGTTGLVQNIPAGIHEFILRDADACADTITFEILSPDAIEVVANIEDAKCKDATDGSIAITLAGGTGVLSANWETGATGNLLSNIGAATYNVSITDENNCRFDTSLVVNEPDSLLLAIDVTGLSCAGDVDGSATAMGSGGMGELTYRWNNGAETAQLNVLPAGVYEVTVTDENNCMTSASAEVISPAPLMVSEMIETPVDCHGNSTGSAIAVVEGGTIPYSFLWDDALAQNSDTAVLLSAGTYQLMVSDANGCTTNSSIIITEPGPLSLDFEVTNINCFGGMDGTADVTVGGGSSPYTYEWNDANNQNTRLATDLLEGNYTLIVTDANGCEIRGEVDIIQPSNPISANIEQTFTSCFGESNSELTAMAAGGTGVDYAYLWSNGQTTEVATNLATEKYGLTITDERGCTASFESPSVTQHPSFDININFDIPTCNGFEDGQAGASVRSGGTGLGYQYRWSSGQDSIFITGVRGGLTYTLTVTDDQGCTGIESRPLPQPEPIRVRLDSSDVICFGENSGTVSITEVTGGNLGYQYQWSANARNATTRNVQDLAVGLYEVTVTDTLGCLGFASVEVVQPPLLAANFEVKDNSCFDGFDGRIRTSVSGGIPSYNLLWSTDERTSTIEGLTSGTYTLTVTDDNGCELIMPVDVGQPTPIELELTAGEITCAGGRDGDFSVLASGGTAPYTYSLDDKSYTSNATFLGLRAGNYDVFVQDRNGCTQSGTADLFDPPAFEVYIFPQLDFLEVEFGNELQLFANAENNSGPVEYVWTPSYPDSTLSCSECFNPTVNPESTIYYELYGIDEAGCEATDRIQIRIAKFRTLRIPTGFTPDGDLLNDLLMTHGTAGTKVLNFQVFDRWGELLYQANDFQVNDPNVGWDGNFRSEKMPPGVYVWLAEVEYEDGVIEVFRGSTQLIR
ncbi:MAG: proprotein convertase P-domain-containing protein [Bacteroidota bacterium]